MEPLAAVNPKQTTSFGSTSASSKICSLAGPKLLAGSRPSQLVSAHFAPASASAHDSTPGSKRKSSSALAVGSWELHAVNSTFMPASPLLPSRRSTYKMHVPEVRAASCCTARWEVKPTSPASPSSWMAIWKIVLPVSLGRLAGSWTMRRARFWVDSCTSLFGKSMAKALGLESPCGQEIETLCQLKCQPGVAVEPLTSTSISTCSVL
mmetsp:Transcript_6852/g.15888  ORF Transcript_6852/g.15888 Transcript_6852/m.15888 type:complete len:208 (-) Transcript_6852:1035-1658(-)